MGSIIIVTRFMNKFIRFNTKSIIRWRDREYELTPDQTFSL